MRELQEQLKKIKSSMKDGKFVGANGVPLAGQDAVKDLLERCLDWSNVVLERYVTSYYSVAINLKLGSD